MGFVTLLLGVVLVAGFSSLLLSHRTILSNVRLLTEQNISQAIGLPVQVDHLHATWTGKIVANRIRVWASHRDGAPLLAEVPKVVVRYSLLDVLKLGKHPIRVDVYQPSIVAYRDRQGRISIEPKLAPSSGPMPEMKLPRFKIRVIDGRAAWSDRFGAGFRLSLSPITADATWANDRLEYHLTGYDKNVPLLVKGDMNTRSGKGQVSAEVLGASASRWTRYLAPAKDWWATKGTFDLKLGVDWDKPDPKSIRINGEVVAKNGEIGLLAIRAPVSNIRGRAHFDNTKVVIDEVKGDVVGNQVHGWGEVRRIDTPNPRLAIEVRAPQIQLETLNKVIYETKPFNLKGNGAAVAHVTGTALDPIVLGNASVPKGEALAETLTDVQGDFRWRLNRVHLPMVMGNWAEGTVTATGSFTTEVIPRLDVYGRWKNVDLAQASAPYAKDIKGLAGQMDGLIHLYGRADKISGDGNVSASARFQGTKIEKVQARYVFDPKSWSVPQLLARVEDAKVSGQAKGDMMGNLRGSLAVQRFSLSSLKSYGVNAEGQVAATGDFWGDLLHPESITANGKLQANPILIGAQRVAHAALDWRYANRHVFISGADISVGHGKIRGSGTIALEPKIAANAQIDVADVDLAGIPEVQELSGLGSLKGKVDSTLAVQWRDNSLKLKGHFKGDRLASSQYGTIDRIEGPIYWGHQVFTTPKMKVSLGGQSLNLNGSVSLASKDPLMDLQVKMQDADLRSLLSTVSWRSVLGSFDASPRSEGLNHPMGLSSAPKAGEAQSLMPILEHWAKTHQDPLEPTAGRKLASTPFWEALDGKVFLDGSFSGSLAEPQASMRLQIRDAKAYGQQLQRVVLSGSYRSDRASVNYFEISEKNGGLLYARGNLGRPHDRLLLSGYRLKLAWLNPWLEGYGAQLNGDAGFTIALTDSLQNPKISFSGKVKDGSVNDFTFSEASTEAAIQDGVLQIEKASVAKDGKEATVSGTYPLADTKGKIAMALRLEDESLGILTALSKEQVDWRGGKGFIEVNLAGTPEKPKLSGRSELADATIKVKGLADPLTKIRGSLFLAKNRLEVSALSARFGTGDVTASGFVNIEDYQPTDVDLHLRSKPFHLKLENGLYDGTVETNIHLTGQVLKPVLSGMIALSRGNIAIQGAAPTTGSSDASFPLTLQNLTVALDSGVNLKSDPMIDLNLQGAMMINGTLAHPQPRGTIKIKGGTVMALTNAFTVTEGRAEFAGGMDQLKQSELDPALYVQAKSRVYDYADKQYRTIIATISGTLMNMKLDFESDPPVAQDRIVEMLGKQQVIMQTLTNQVKGSEVLTREASDWINTLITNRMMRPITNQVETWLPFIDDFGFDLVSDPTKKDDVALSGLNLSFRAETKPLFGNLTMSYRHQFREQNRDYYRFGVNYRLTRTLGMQYLIEPNDSPDAWWLTEKQRVGLNHALQLTAQVRF